MRAKKRVVGRSTLMAWKRGTHLTLPMEIGATISYQGQGRLGLWESNGESLEYTRWVTHSVYFSSTPVPSPFISLKEVLCALAENQHEGSV